MVVRKSDPGRHVSCRVFPYQTTFGASLLSLWIAIEGVVVYSNLIKIGNIENMVD